MKTTAAVLVELGQPLELVDLTVPSLKPGQVLVQMTYSGVCHTQLGEVRGKRGPDAFLPHCLGHEGTGVVKEVGAGVTRVKVDDTVVLSWIKGSGQNVPGSVYDWNGKSVNAGGVTTFSQLTVASENRVARLPAGVSTAAGALLGCPIPTGAGAVWNTAQARPGMSLAVLGAGGVGCCAIAAAAAAGCHPVVAVDRQPYKLELARKMGASATVLADIEPGQLLSKLRELAGGGFDVIVETAGVASLMSLALQAVRPQGGIAVVVGNAPFGEAIAVDPRWLNDGKQLRGTWGGDNDPERDWPRYGRWIASNKLNLDPLIGKRYPLTQVNQALADLEHGTVGRPLLDFSL